MPLVRRFALTLFALALSMRSSVDADEYLANIKPLFQERCFACHGALKQEAGLRLDTGALVRKGSDSGPVINTDSVDESLLLTRIASSDDDVRMPPIGKPLSESEIHLIRQWIRLGATSPINEEPEQDPAKHWAFQPPLRSQPPSPNDPAWPKNAVDSFVHAQHVQHGLKPAPDATSAQWLRRVHLDLTGLPPTVEQVGSFPENPSDTERLAVVDRLLNSPEYGERWGRHWLDVWRYSDWYGRRQQNDVRNSAPQIWRWRDWVVDSLNADKSYARMVQEMLAADELAADDDSAWPATGYLIRNYYSLNPNEWMRHNVEYTGKAFLGLTFNCAHCHDHKYDPIAHEDYFRFRAFFEPIGIRQDRVAGEAEPPPFEVYKYGGSRKVVRLGMARIYDAAPEATTWFYTGGDERLRVTDRGSIKPGVPAFLQALMPEIKPVQLPQIAWSPGSRPAIQQAVLSERRETVRVAAEALASLRPQNDPTTYQAPLESADQQGATPPMSHHDALRRAAELRVAAATLNLKAAEAVVAADNANASVGSQQDQTSDAKKAAPTSGADVTDLTQRAAIAQHDAAAAEIRWRIADAQAQRREFTSAPQDDSSKAKKLAELDSLLAAAQKEMTQLESAPVAKDRYQPFSPTTAPRSTGRRTALALWITDRSNPLAARVAVNHIWMRHFHAPLVASVYDFGRNGKLPTHPELLDWLAVELMENDWSMKHIHRLIVTSRTYAMSSSSQGLEKNLAADKDNRYLWRMNRGRMEAEVVRDSVLFVAKKLELRRGGQPLLNTQAMTTYRRSLYYEFFPEDGGVNELSEIFDPPDPIECFRRTTTIVPQQALALSNSELIHQAAGLVAQSIVESIAPSITQSIAESVSQEIGRTESTSADHDETFITQAFRRVLSRDPSARERQSVRRFLEIQRALLPDEASVSESLVRVLFNHNDFVTIR